MNPDDVKRRIAEDAKLLEAMAIAAGLDFLAYLLSMAQEEAATAEP